MKHKKLLALILATLMFVCLFSACGPKDNAKTDSGSKTDTKTDSKTDTNSSDSNDTTVPTEDDVTVVKWLSVGTSENLDIAIEGNYENYLKLIDVMHSYGIEYDTSYAEGEVYVSTVNSLAAGDALPDLYGTYGYLDNNTIVSWIEAGYFVPLNEALEYSSGNMIKVFGEDGKYAWARAKATYADGEWYYVLTTNNPMRNVQITESDGPLRVPVQNHGVYAVMIRQDWLDALDIDMPTTAEEYYEACLAVQQADANGNTLADERIIMGLGTEYQQQGVGLWFGMPFRDFFSDPSNGEIEVGMLKKGYSDWATYLNRFYDAGLIYSGEGGHPWSDNTSFIAENNVISIWCQPEVIWTSGRTNTGDDNCNYQPMPIIAAVDGEKARIVCQEATAGEFGIGYNSSTLDAETVANCVDFMFSYELWELFYLGIEGKSFEYAEDGVSIIDYTAAVDYERGVIEEQYLAFEDMEKAIVAGSTLAGVVPVPRDDDVWNPNAKTYASIEDAIAAGEPYAEKYTTEEEWQQQQDVDYHWPSWQSLNELSNYGEENINCACYYDFDTLPTPDEAAVQAQYGTDLKTYLTEVGTKLVMGEYNIADLQSYIDKAYDTLGLQEYIDAQAARVDRFFVAIGLK